MNWVVGVTCNCPPVSRARPSRYCTWPLRRSPRMVPRPGRSRVNWAAIAGLVNSARSTVAVALSSPASMPRSGLGTGRSPRAARSALSRLASRRLPRRWPVARNSPRARRKDRGRRSGSRTAAICSPGPVAVEPVRLTLAPVDRDACTGPDTASTRVKSLISTWRRPAVPARRGSARVPRRVPSKARRPLGRSQAGPLTSP